MFMKKLKEWDSEIVTNVVQWVCVAQQATYSFFCLRWACSFGLPESTEKSMKSRGRAGSDSSLVLLTTSIIQKRFLTGVKTLFIIQWLKPCIHNKWFLLHGPELGDLLAEGNKLTGDNVYGFNLLAMRPNFDLPLSFSVSSYIGNKTSDYTVLIDQPIKALKQWHRIIIIGEENKSLGTHICCTSRKGGKNFTPFFFNLLYHALVSHL